MNDIKNIRVKDVMSRNVVTVGTDTTMRAVESILSEQKFHHLPVLNEQQDVVGIISRKEIDTIKTWGHNSGVRVFEKQSEMLLDSLLASECMTKQMKTIQEEDTLSTCAALFFSNSFHAMPVMREGKIVGMITTYDLLRTAYK